MVSPTSTQNSRQLLAVENPFFEPSDLPFAAPDFTKIENEHFLPAFEEGMRRHLEEVREIAASDDQPTFENTLTALEKTGDLLTRVSRVFFNLTAAHTSPEIQRIQAEVAPKLAAHSDNILLDKQLFERVQQLYESRDDLDLNQQQQQLLRLQYEQHVRAGALLDDQQQARIREINEELSALTTQFQENLLAITRERAVIVEDRDELDGMPSADIAAAAEAATQRGHEGKYLLNITNTTRQPVLTSLNNRDLRQRVWEASAYRGLGRDGGIDNRPLVLQIAKLRAERAKLLGHPNWSSYALENQMAREPQAALTMLTDLVPAVVAKTKAEAEEIKALMQQEGHDHELEPWDWEYFAEKVRKAKYDIDENEVRPYFELDTVLKDGVFFTMERLYGIEFRERDDIPVYHPDVRVFDVFDQDGEQLGLFYADYFARDSKRGGAWMNSFVVQSELLDQKPVVVNVLNIPPPAEGEPALISFDNAVTLFHEMGHAVHGLFSDVRYPSIAGTAVPRDYVEFPSTFHEDWAIDPEVLENYARHHETGERLPSELLDRVLQAQKFNQGFDTLEYVSAALLDLEWHMLDADSIPDDMEQFEARALAKHEVDYGPVPPRYKTAYFAHVWPGGYASSYYAYLWSEVLAADAFAYIDDRYGLTTEAGNRFRQQILSRGHTRPPMEQYTEFRGQEPDVQALLERRGLTAAESH